MIDPKVYKTDYESEFTSFFKELPADQVESVDASVEKEKYSKLNKLRDKSGTADSRDKLWEGF